MTQSDIRLPQMSDAQEKDLLQAIGDYDYVLVPRSLLGAACCAIRKKLDAPKTVAGLRRYTTGDLSKAAQAQPLTEEQYKFLRFLGGYCEWDGTWFGEPHRMKSDAYWWREEMHNIFKGIGAKNDTI